MSRPVRSFCNAAIVLVFIVLTGFAAFAQHSVEATRQFTITGLVDKPVVLDIAAILKYPQVAIGDIVVRNHRGAEKEIAKGVKGVLLKQVFDSVHIAIKKPKELSQVYLVFTASDGYKNVYSWSELFNTGVGNHVYIITEKDGTTIGQMEGDILIVSTADLNAGTRHFKSLRQIEVKKAE